MSRVFLVEPVRANIDVSSAEKFGELVYIFGPNAKRVSVFKTQEYCVAVLDILRSMDYDPEEDIFCISGSMVPVAVTLSALVAEFVAGIEVLFYNSIEDGYARRTMKAEDWISYVDDEISVEVEVDRDATITPGDLQSS